MVSNWSCSSCVVLSSVLTRGVFVHLLKAEHSFVSHCQPVSQSQTWMSGNSFIVFIRRCKSPTLCPWKYRVCCHEGKVFGFPLRYRTRAKVNEGSRARTENSRQGNTTNAPSCCHLLLPSLFNVHNSSCLFQKRVCVKSIMFVQRYK